MDAHSGSGTHKWSVAIVGAGGNIGSHLAPHIARLACVGRVLLVDPDRYDASNVRSQNIRHRDVGKSKVAVQRRCLSEINPALEVVAIAEAIESVPLGHLRVDVILTGLDTMRSRMTVNEIGCRLRVPWIDAGVQAGGSLVRISSYYPDSDAACLECGFGPDDYAAVEQAYACGDVAAPATLAAAYLGGLAGTMAAAECDQLLRRAHTQGWGGHEVVFDLGSRRLLGTSLRRNSRCRLNHTAWVIQELATGPRELKFGDAISLVARDVPAKARTLQLEGHAFITRLTCVGCSRSRRLLRLSNRLRRHALICRRCGGEMVATAFDRMHVLRASSETFKRVSGHSLERAGFRAGDVITVCAGDNVSRFELGD